MAKVTLSGRHVRLEPLERAHVEALIPIAQDPELWRIGMESAGSPELMRAYVERALAARDAGLALPFVTVEQKSGTVVGSTRFGNYDRVHRRIEIGWTWIAAPWQRTAVNTEAKLLMLAHAFETLELRRVELKTDVLNARSRAAILRLGATEEGVFRQHVATWNGRVRDSVWFSILGGEWPAVRERLVAKLAGR
ncbi:MAG: GNAT family N-acetyltransferase [Gemmatimonadaceae bacterium]|nr:GNAT family N-acetyltransferase [Gemmatimonadaceae bacterium]NUQ94254.1 GNAT family N-acetyltransferase [Gemmatimonadaceae bacterium]NUR19802.1 GNAT family N-acetyltransferase [Gemmatimonadaceae bacterium]NUS96826.1 GNAT family N-acetyltransferase [Gemmatimonadaceae bacterium]